MVYYDACPPFSDGLVRGKKIVLALSGGADSTALLHLLAMERDRGNTSLIAAHFHHGIRGAEADGDRDACRNMCGKLGVPCVFGGEDVPARAARDGVGLESAARSARYEFLRRVLRENGFDRIALAHHMDDQAETVLMHLLRGAGLSGLAGMAEDTGELVRPLLSAKKQQILDFLRVNGISWREDGTNALPDNPRNRLRISGIPALREAYPDATAALARLSRVAGEEARFVGQAAEEFLAHAAENGAYGRRIRVRPLPDRAVLLRALHRELGGEVYSEKLLEIADLCAKDRGKADAGGGCAAEKAGDYLYFVRNVPREIAPVPLRIPGETVLPGICRVMAEWTAAGIGRDEYDIVLDGDALFDACLRVRRAGDRIVPLGMRGEKTLSDYMTDRKLDRPVRDVTPLVARGNRVLAVAGVGISASAATRENTKQAVRLKFRMEDCTNA